MKQAILICTILFFLLGCIHPESRKNIGDPPSILLVVSEDHSQHLSCYGDTVISTPNLDNIAREGIMFRNAYVTQTVCSPSRSSILTGLYPHQNGHLGLATHGYHFVGDVKNIYSLMKQAGYRTGMIGKLHLNPAGSFPIDYHPIKGGNFEKLGLPHYWEFADSFMRASDEPFFLMVNFPDSHWPLQDEVEGRPSDPVSPDQVVSFPYIGFDNERIRNVTANYYNCMLRLDECIGELMNTLNGTGRQDNTLVFFLSDHGDQMARGKYDVYEAGSKVPFLIKWPGEIPSGTVSDALVSTVDIVPTILDATGVDLPDNLAGKSLVPLFADPALDFREYLFVEKNCDNKGTYFPRRAVRDKKYKLIYTLLQDRVSPVAEIYIRHSEHGKAAYVGCPTPDDLETAPDPVKRMYQDWLQPPKIQLFDLENDPWEFTDISEDPEYAAVKERLLGALSGWQEKTDDPLRFPGRLRDLTTEHDTIASSSRRNTWLYPEYLYDNE